MSTIAPESMTAADRREAWDNRMNTGDDPWAYSLELRGMLRTPFLLIESLVGQELAAPHLLPLLWELNAEGDTVEEAVEDVPAGPTNQWAIGVVLDNAGIYGLYGVTSDDVPLVEREDWIATLMADLEKFLELAQPDPQGAIARITNLAAARWAIDQGEGEVDVASLAVLGGVSEGRLRNILSSGDGVLEKAGGKVTAQSAAAWLKGRKEFFASIWRQPDDAAPEPPASGDFEDEVVFVPVAADGSFFHPGLARGGKFAVGAKGEMLEVSGFDEALDLLQKMATPRWRRPNEAGNWGIVTGRSWKRISRSELMREV